MRLINFIFSLIILCTCSTLYAEEIRDFYAEPGLHPFKDPIQSQSDSIDPFSGMLRIQATDLVIPGNGGMDIRITRSYTNPQNQISWYNGVVGIGWTMHFGRIVVPSSAIDKVCQQQNYNITTGDNPSLEHQDGSRELLVIATDGSNDLVTKSNWRASCLPSTDGFLVKAPDGTKYIMDAVDYTNPLPTQEKSWFVSSITDIHGNSIAISYVSNNGLYYINQVKGIKPDGNPDGRVVDYHYASDPGCNRLTSITTNNVTISYNLTPASGYLANTCKYQLSDVSYPEQLSWHYDYLGITTDGTAGSSSLISSTNPYGGQTSYTYQYIYFDPTSSIMTSSVRTKSTSGSGVTPGTWTYTFNPHSLQVSDPNTGVTTYADVTSVTEPYGKTEYVHQGYASSGPGSYWAVGLLLGKQVYDDANNILEWGTYQWDKRIVSYEHYYHGRADLTNVQELDPETDSPILLNESIWRDNGTHQTIYSNYDAYGNPGVKEETTIISGEPNRITRYTYINDTAKWIIGKVQTEAIDGIGSISRTFDAATYDVLSENKYGVTTTYTYTSEGDVQTVTDANGNVTTYSDYYRGIPRREEHPENRVITRTVNDSGTISTYVNGLGNTTSYSYDPLNRLTGIATPINNPISVTWTPYTSLPAERNVTRGGLVQTIKYDGFGRPLEQRYTDTSSGNTVTKTFGYDALGRKIFESYPNSSTGDSYQYDNLGRRTKVTHADGTTRLTVYGTGGIVITETDERGNQSSYLFRAYGSPDRSPVLLNANTPGSICTYSEYNLLNQLTMVFQGSLASDGTCNGYPRNYNYNSKYQLISEQNPEIDTITYGRDAIGNMISRQVGASGVTSYHYDGLLRRTLIDYSDSTPDTTFTYDSENNLVSVNNGISLQAFSYDANNNLLLKTTTIDGSQYSLGYQYDGNDALATMTYPSGRTVDYSPDSFGRPTKAAPYVNSVTYHPSGQLASMTYANGVTTDIDIQQRLWVSRIHTHGSNNLIDLNYAYDPIGNITAINDGVDATQNRAMAYDDADRLISATGSWGTNTYAYDANGNITQKVINGTASNYTYFNLLVTSYGAAGDTKQVTHDVYGNVEYITKNLVLSSEERHFMYDESGALSAISKQVTLNGQTTTTVETNSFDGMGDRVKKIGDGATTYYMSRGTGFIVGEYTGDPTYGKEYFYLGNQLIAAAQTNQPPVANAGADITVAGNQSVTLSGSASNDPDGTIQSYAWQQTAGTPVTLTNANSATPSFTAPLPATTDTLTFQLTVTDNDGDSSSDSINVIVQGNTPPVANAGPDQTVTGGFTVYLNGTGSSDAEGPIASYLWQQTSGPSVALNGATTATPSFSAPRITTSTVLTFNLTVTDGSGATSIDSVAITVNPPPVLPHTTATVTKSKVKGVTYFSIYLTTNEPFNQLNWQVTSGGSANPTSPSPLVGAPITITVTVVDSTVPIYFSFWSVDMSDGYVEPTNTIQLQ